VVIFATNLAANFDPAFERRIRTHVRFEMPGIDEREQIWGVQVHPHKTPLAPDVDFHALAEKFVMSGGDIKNAVLKAAVVAAAESGPERTKQIHQQHLDNAAQDVLAAKTVMKQSLFEESAPDPMRVFQELHSRVSTAVMLAAGALVAAVITLAIVLLR
jgi:ATP-dependent 26S proteasome regulatory subunit